jgi:hypothetical protein
MTLVSDESSKRHAFIQIRCNGTALFHDSVRSATNSSASHIYNTRHHKRQRVAAVARRSCGAHSGNKRPVGLQRGHWEKRVNASRSYLWRHKNARGQGPKEPQIAAKTRMKYFKLVRGCWYSLSRMFYPLEHSGNYTYHHLYAKILCSAHTVHLCVLYGSENKQRLFPYKTLTDWFL